MKTQKIIRKIVKYLIRSEMSLTIASMMSISIIISLCTIVSAICNDTYTTDIELQTVHNQPIIIETAPEMKTITATEEEIKDIIEEIKSSVIIVEEEPQPTEIIHVVEEGDSYYAISYKYYNDEYYGKALAIYNEKDFNSILDLNDSLIIPDINDEEFKLCIEEAENIVEEVIVQETEVVYNNIESEWEYQFGSRNQPAVEINIPTDYDMKNYKGYVDTSSYTYIGQYFCTGYTPTCAHCCGGSTAGIAASGVKAIPGYTVATSSDIPFGTTLYIEGYGYYVVEDRGVGPGIIDIASPTHEACGPITAHNINVYIVK